MEILEKSEMYLVSIGTVLVLLGCFWHYRLDEHGITQLYFGAKSKYIAWNDVVQIGILYTTTYAKGGGRRYIVIIPKGCELPNISEYNGMDYIRCNEKQIIKFPSRSQNIRLVEKYYGPLDFSS